jgi:hypothetical protein
MHPVTPAMNARDQRFPASLHARRYSHLMEEAVAISQGEHPADDEPEPEPAPETAPPSSDEEEDEGEQDPDESVVLVSAPRAQQPQATLGARVKGFFWSYLAQEQSKPTRKPRRSHVPAPPGVPLPPPEAYARPRPEAYTPARPEPPRAPAPKELVQLHPAPPPLPPVPPRAPRRLVALRPVSPPAPAVGMPLRRRDSGGSVKELVRSFEAMEDYHALVEEGEARKVALRRQQSRESLQRRRSASGLHQMDDSFGQEGG